ncbi:toll/interleukin-1 receptor domain-containing protein [Novosphingobium sp. G106]|uniref:toll/interleukin-1 receptor domain-containing protein n=1 Tax=Novosphingobium sp. G106 TaxID=2849500 RepID=UPI001C2D36F8|nr:toll/interleukin-1 receptor domain-containing protein [Novosphingobium sp. G106]MBV1690842.1 toll/interleukin-1 receptor domain-containing protein [Novosphingobium sp. G106]
MQKDKIFINYRRDDAGGFAGRLADSLTAYFGPGRVFRDVTGIDYGDDFERVIDEKLAESGALVVVIGDRWSSATNAEGARRLDDPGDYVIREIAAALRSAIPVIPVLIGNAAMPRPGELPDTLGDLSRRNAITVTDERWEFDVNRLAKVLAIDVPGSVAQRRLDRLKAAALAMLLLSGAFVTLAFCAALRAGNALGESLIAAGFTPLASAVPFIAIILAGALTLNALPLMEEARRKFGWSAVGLSATGTLVSFVVYTLTNHAEPSWSLIVNFAASTVITLALLVLVALAGFRAK